MFNFLTTLFNSTEHAMVQKLGGYKKAAKISANLNLLHKIQDSHVIPTEFYDEEVNNNNLTLDQILKLKDSTVVDMTGEKPS